MMIMSNNASASQGRGEVSSNTDDDFSFKYTESGGLTARYLLISFDSKTNVLTTSSDISGSNISQRPLSDTDKIDFKNTITETEFFKNKTDYPPEKEDDPTLVAYSLAITMGSDKTHTTAWTNTSKGMPDNIKKVVDEIKKVVDKEKAV
jgi:hypothetical protein